MTKMRGFVSSFNSARRPLQREWRTSLFEEDADMRFPFLPRMAWLVAAMLIIAPTLSPAAGSFKPVHVKDGVFRYDDGTEVALFGTNYYPMSWYQYNNMKAAKADFRAVIHRDVADMKMMGVQVVRVHVFDKEMSDAQGHLVDNVHLEIFDMLVDELQQQGIYLYLTTLTWWNSPVERPDAFGKQVTKMGMIFNEQALSASERFVGELLAHKNRYTGVAFKDSPQVAMIEIINEPWYFPYDAVVDPTKDHVWHKGNETPAAVYQRDLTDWKARWTTYSQAHGNSLTSNTYAAFQQEVMTQYLRRMQGAIRKTGATQPIGAALFETCYCPGVLAAIAQSDVDIVVDGWYPGGFGYNENHNLFKEADNYDLDASLRGKARAIYEFDSPGTYENVAMYPAMARRYRSMGAQVACQFQYDSIATAMDNCDWDAHYLSLEYTPAKAVAFQVAALAFNEILRGTRYATPADRQVFGHFAVAFDPKQVLLADDNRLLHAQPLTTWQPLPMPATPKLIMGRGESPLVNYDGSGFYRLEQMAPGQWQVYISPDVVHGPVNELMFSKRSLGSKVVQLDMTKPRTLTLKPAPWHKLACRNAAGRVSTTTDGKIQVMPGQRYTLTMHP
jgi:hypothetical protein